MDGKEEKGGREEESELETRGPPLVREVLPLTQPGRDFRWRTKGRKKIRDEATEKKKARNCN